jgi:CheY-like chemotaxis protein
MLPNEHILIVEDDPHQLTVIREVLRDGRIGNGLHTVTTGEEAIEYLSASGKYADRQTYPAPCLVLLDLKLPGMSGFDVLQWIRSSSDFKKLPVVVLTGSRDHQDLERGYALGVNSYLFKPFAIEELRALVKSINAYWVILAQKPLF